MAAAALVAQKVVSQTEDETLPLVYFMQTGEVLLKKARGTILHKAHTKRVAAATLGVDASDVPATIDGSQELVMDLAFPKRGFKRSAFATNSARVKDIAEAYASVGRAEASDALRRERRGRAASHPVSRGRHHAQTGVRVDRQRASASSSASV